MQASRQSTLKLKSLDPKTQKPTDQDRLKKYLSIKDRIKKRHTPTLRKDKYPSSHKDCRQTASAGIKTREISQWTELQAKTIGKPAQTEFQEGSRSYKDSFIQKIMDKIRAKMGLQKKFKLQQMNTNKILKSPQLQHAQYRILLDQWCKNH